ncbi:MAG: hypothetical protein Q7K45_02775, partial [Nanoarchaeota archaeon]|nr:hypothetical protein [Nanoarchaeota archaeon]
MKEKRGLIILLIALVLLINIINLMVMYSVELPSTQTITGKASNNFGDVDICIARPPDTLVIANQAATQAQLFTYQASTTFYGSNSSITFFDNTSLFAISSSGYISFTPVAADVGSHHILITAQDASGCAAFNVTDDFILTIAAAAGAGTGDTGAGGGGGGAGGGGGGGGGGGEAPQTIEKVPKPSFMVSDKHIKATVKQSQRAEKQLIIKNTGDASLEIDIFSSAQYVALTPESFTLPVDGEQEVLVAFNPQQNAQPEIYSGKLTVVGTFEDEELSKEIPVILEVESERVLFDGSLDLDKKSYASGESIQLTISVSGIFPGEARLVYGISNLDGNSIYTEEETISIEQQVSFSKQIRLPEGIDPGEYVFSMKIIQGESFSTATELFTVEAEPSALAGLAAPFSKRPYFILSIPLVLLLVVILFIAVYIIHRRTKKMPAALRKIQKTASKPAPKMAPIQKTVQKDNSVLQHKLSVLKEGYSRGYIKE